MKVTVINSENEPREEEVKNFFKIWVSTGKTQVQVLFHKNGVDFDLSSLGYTEERRWNWVKPNNFVEAPDNFNLYDLEASLKKDEANEAERNEIIKTETAAISACIESQIPK